MLRIANSMNAFWAWVAWSKKQNFFQLLQNMLNSCIWTTKVRIQAFFPRIKLKSFSNFKLVINRSNLWRNLRLIDWGLKLNILMIVPTIFYGNGNSRMWLKQWASRRFSNRNTWMLMTRIGIDSRSSCEYCDSLFEFEFECIETSQET